MRLPVPGVVSVLAAQARCASVAERASVRMRTLDGRWFELDASALVDASGSVAVVIQPAAVQSIRDAVLRALGLSAREREVALAGRRGPAPGRSRWTLP